MAGVGQLKTNGCGCCFVGGPHDFYGNCHGFDIEDSATIYRTPSGLPTAAIGYPGVYSSLDEVPPWSVDVFSGEFQAARIQLTIAPKITDGERCWAMRNENPLHPDADWGGNIIERQALNWSEGDDAAVRRRVLELDTVEESPYTSDQVFISTSTGSLNDAQHLFTLVAKEREASWLRVEFKNWTGPASSSVTYLDLENHTGATTQAELEEDFWQYRIETTARDASGASIEIRLVDDSGETEYTGADGDGATVGPFSLHEFGLGQPLHDVVLINAETQSVITFNFPSLLTPLNGTTDHAPLFPETLVAGNLSARRSLPGTLSEEVAHSHGNQTIGVSANANEMAFPALGSTDDPPNNVLGPEPAYSGDEGIYVVGGPNYFGTAASRFAFEYPETFYLPEFAFDYERAEGCAASMNGGPSIPRILIAPAHTFPKVFSYQEPRLVYEEQFTDVGEFDSSHWITRDLWEDVGHSATILYGAISKSQFSFTQNLLSDLATVEEELLTATGDVVITRENTLDRIKLFLSPGAGAPHLELSVPADPPGVFMNLLWADAYRPSSGADDDVPAVIVSVSTLAVEITSEFEPPEIPFYADSPNTLQQPVEDQTYTHELILVIGFENEVRTWTVWRDGEIGNGNYARATGLMALHVNSSGAAFVWFESLYSIAIEVSPDVFGRSPSEEEEGICTGWRMHVTDASGDDLWTIDSRQPDQSPVGIASSDRFFYVGGFELCDVRLDGDQHHGTWAFTHDGSYSWPWRQIVDGAEDSAVTGINAGSAGNLYRDSIKNSARLPLTPAINIYPDREDVNYVDELLEPVSGFDADVDADFVDNKLILTLDETSTELAQILPSSGSPLSNRFRYRLTVEAQAAEHSRLLVRMTNFHGAGSHLSAWLELSNGTYASTAGALSSTVEDLGGGRYKYMIFAESGDLNDFFVDPGSQLYIRLVDGTSEEINQDADAEYGLFVYAVSLSSKCLA